MGVTAEVAGVCWGGAGTAHHLLKSPSSQLGGGADNPTLPWLP